MIVPEHIIKEVIMPRAKRKTTTRRKKSTTKDNPFFEAVVKGGKKIFSPK
jgi:hypothetical protein|tara:strand:- start:42 stop:191 length:150 start_codon:yes stop_codon:yes gene_type:complete